MMTTRIVLQTNRLRVFAFDAVVNEQHTSSDEVPSFPVERGVVVSDHVRRAPETITLSGLTGDIAVSEDAVQPASGQRPKDAFFLLQELRGQLLDVLTSMRVYRDMMITGISTTRKDANIVLDATVTLRQVRTVETQTIKLPDPVAPIGNATKQVGKVTTTAAPTPAAASDDTILGQMLNSIGKATKTDTEIAKLLRAP